MNSQPFLITELPIDLRQDCPRADTSGPLTSISMHFAGLCWFAVSQAQMTRSSVGSLRIKFTISDNVHSFGEKRQPDRESLHLMMMRIPPPVLTEDRPNSIVLKRHRLAFALHLRTARPLSRKLCEQHLSRSQFREELASFISLSNLGPPWGLHTGILIKEFARTVPRSVMHNIVMVKQVAFMVMLIFHRNAVKRWIYTVCRGTGLCWRYVGWENRSHANSLLHRLLHQIVKLVCRV